MSHWRHTMVDGTEFWISCQLYSVFLVAEKWFKFQRHLPSCGINVTSWFSDYCLCDSSLEKSQVTAANIAGQHLCKFRDNLKDNLRNNWYNNFVFNFGNNLRNNFRDRFNLTDNSNNDLSNNIGNNFEGDNFKDNFVINFLNNLRSFSRAISGYNSVMFHLTTENSPSFESWHFQLKFETSLSSLR